MDSFTILFSSNSHSSMYIKHLEGTFKYQTLVWSWQSCCIDCFFSLAIYFPADMNGVTLRMAWWSMSWWKSEFRWEIKTVTR